MRRVRQGGQVFRNPSGVVRVAALEDRSGFKGLARLTALNEDLGVNLVVNVLLSFLLRLVRRTRRLFREGVGYRVLGARNVLDGEVEEPNLGNLAYY